MIWPITRRSYRNEITMLLLFYRPDLPHGRYRPAHYSVVTPYNIPSPDGNAQEGLNEEGLSVELNGVSAWSLSSNIMN